MMARGPAAATATRISCCGLAACSTQNCRGQYRRAVQLRSVLLRVHVQKCRHLRARALQVLGQAPRHLPRPPKDYALVIVQRAGQQAVQRSAQRGACIVHRQQHRNQWHARIVQLRLVRAVHSPRC